VLDTGKRSVQGVFSERELQGLVVIAREILSRLWNDAPIAVRRWAPPTIRIYVGGPSTETEADPYAFVSCHADPAKASITIQERDGKRWVNIRRHPQSRVGYIALFLSRNTWEQRREEVHDTLVHELLHALTQPALSCSPSVSEAFV